MHNQTTDVVIIGAGISGLSCARHLLNTGVRFLILEAGTSIGGRIKTDRINGFNLDHGFQVLQTAYPEARRQLNFDKLELKAFAPGVAVHVNGKLHYISDPIRRPNDLWSTLTSPIGIMADRFRLLRLFADNRMKGAGRIFELQDSQTTDFLHSWHFSDQMIQRFFKPFFGGISLDPDINTSSRVFRYLFDIFASGDVALPARGMGAVPEQLAEGLPEDRIFLGSKVNSIDGQTVTLKNESTITGKAIVIATQGPEAGRLSGQKSHSDSRPERCLYFTADKPPISKPFLILNGQGKGLINNIVIPTLNAPSYSSSGKHLITVVVLNNMSLDPSCLKDKVHRELADWFGETVNTWQHLKTYHIEHALSDQSPPVANPFSGFTKIRDGLFTCGEYQSVPGIQWALLSGRLMAEQLIKDFKQT